MLTIDSKRLDMKSIDLSIPFESFLMKLFGVRMVNKHGIKDEKTWKIYLAKIANAIEKSINRNVTSDSFHRFRLQSHVDQIKEALKSKELVEPEVIHHLTAIVFELLGGVPDYRERRVVNRRDDYTLCHMRTLYYNQSSYQRVITILEASKWKPFSEFHKHDDLEDKYFSDFPRNPDGFIMWYKQKYPEVYLKLF